MISISTREVKAGVVGCGVVAASYYLPYLMSHATLVAVCDTNEERAVASARLFGAREHYRDYFEMLELSDIDVVFILTGPGTHSRFAIAAAEAGRHFLLQKPMATTLEDAEAIVRAVRKAGVMALIEPSAHSPSTQTIGTSKVWSAVGRSGTSIGFLCSAPVRTGIARASG